jgi:uncharacterized protein DUF4190
MTNSGGADEWWQQYSGDSAAPAVGSAGSAPQYPMGGPTSYPSAPSPANPSSYPSMPPPSPAPQYPSPQYQNYPNQQVAYGNPSYSVAGYQPYGYAQPPGSNGLAIAAMVVSFAGLITCGIGALVGLILGVVALNQIKQTGQEGRSMALTAIWVGAITMTLTLAYIVIMIAVSGTT